MNSHLGFILKFSSVKSSLAVKKCKVYLFNGVGLQRCGKSCRLRWVNYLRPDLKRGKFSPQEISIITQLHRILGNRWSQIAKHLPGRTDNEVKNFWNTSIKKKFFSRAVSDLATLSHVSNHHSVNPNFIIDTQQEYFQLPNPMSVLQSSDNGDLNVLGMTPNMLQDGSPFDPNLTWSSNYQPLDQNQEHDPDQLLLYTTQVDSKSISMAFCDPAVMPEMPKLCEILELDMDECTGLPSSSTATHEVDPSLFYGSHPYVPTNQMEYILAAMMPSSSPSSVPCGHLGMNPN